MIIRLAQIDVEIAERLYDETSNAMAAIRLGPDPAEADAHGDFGDADFNKALAAARSLVGFEK